MAIKDINDYISRDLAGTYRGTRSSASELIPAEVTMADLETVQRQGYIVIENLISNTELEEIRSATKDLLNNVGRNEFEGLKTQRVYAVLAKTRALDRLIEHPRILAMLDQLFLPNYLLSQCQVINILSGEDSQALHYDDGFYPLPRPRPPLGAATVWAIDDFTEQNGATAIVPGSHTWGDDRFPDISEVRSAVMPAGSVVFYPGTFWHGGGANRTDKSRLAITCQYCEPWVRTQENYSLSVPKHVVGEVSENIRRMLGYSIHSPFIGMVNGMHPKRLLEDL